MRTYFINSDAVSNNGKSFHEEWLRRGLAVTSGELAYREKLGSMAFGDQLLLYVKQTGVVAIGQIADHGVVDVQGGEKVSQGESIEYHRAVKWTVDLRAAPVTLDELRREIFIPQPALIPIDEDNPKLPSFLAFLSTRTLQRRRVNFTPDQAREVLRKLRQSYGIEELPEKNRSQQFHFGPPFARTLLLSRDLHESWVRIYINRQSRAQEWFPVGMGEPFQGVELGFRYLQGYKPPSGRPGIAASASATPTLNPNSHHVLMLHVSDEAGFTELVNWYAGKKRLGPGTPPSGNEVSGQGFWQEPVPAMSTSLDMTPLVDLGLDAIRTVAADAKPAPPFMPLESVAAEDPASGAGYLNDAAKRTAVEHCAIQRACLYYEEHGYKVQVLGKPYDLLCTKRGETVHVEVKGSVGTAVTVRLTRNEVADARNDGWRSDLFVVSGINLSSDADGTWAGSGGTHRVFVDWAPEDKDLSPTEFEYRLPSLAVER